MTARSVAPMLVVFPVVLGAQITRSTYYDYLPAFPRIVMATRASTMFQVYGDHAAADYRDQSPRDGIDDARGAQLQALIGRFAPVMRPNNFSVPRDLDAIFGSAWTLNIDGWSSSGAPVSRDSIRIAYRGELNVTDDDATATALRTLLERMGPSRPRRGYTPAEGDVDTVLFIDMPGSDAPTWRAAYEHRRWERRSRLFAHVFIWDDSASHAAAHYALVVQYWFFYPFNDAVNEHEGDWEHINVLLTPHAYRAAGAAPAELAGTALLDSLEVVRALRGDRGITDSLAIGAVDYYFHQNVVRLDYMSLATDGTDSSTASDRRYFWEDANFVSRTLVARLTVGGGKLAAHPLVFIGGNNKGPDELLAAMPRFGGSFKRNSGSSYPFPGTWQAVAGFGVTETVNGRVVPRVNADPAVALDSSIEDAEFMTYGAEDIELIPDWERVERLVIEEPAVRREWAWLVLPIYWGFPATVSPGAGLVAHTDLGNIAPPGPAYNDGWNRAGGPPQGRYRLRVLRTPVSPTTPWANLRNGWGLLNLPLAAWGLMPGYNVAIIQLTPWTEGALQFVGAPPPRTFTPGRLPRRFTSEGQGIAWGLGGAAYGRLLPQHDPAIGRLLAANPGSAIDRGSVRHDASPGPSLWFNLFFGDRFALENSYAWSVDRVSYRIDGSEGRAIATVGGTLKLAELNGGISYSLAAQRSGFLDTHLRAGYGWTRYSVEEVSLSGAQTRIGGVHGGYLPPLLPGPKWWPNTVYAGGDVELFTARRQYMLHRLGYGIRLDVTGRLSRIGADADGTRRARSAKGGSIGLVTHFGW